MGVLRDQMIRELQLRRYAPATQKAYLEAVVGLTKYFHMAPDQLSARQVQDYLLYLMMEPALSEKPSNHAARFTSCFQRLCNLLAVGPSRPSRRNSSCRH